MVVTLAVHHIVALVVAAGHKSHVAHVDGPAQHGIRGIDIRGLPRVLHAAGPLGTVRLFADGAQVAAHAHQSAGQAPGFGGLAHHLHSVAFAHAANVQRHFRVGQIDGLGVLVDDEIVDVAVLGGGLQLFHGRQLVVGVCLRFSSYFAVVVPDVQHAAHGDVQLSVRGLVHPVGQFQHREDAVIHLYRGLAGVVVDGLDIGHTGVIVVDVKELVVADKVGVEFAHLGGELLLAFAVGDDLRHRVEYIVKDSAVTGQLFLLFGGTACQQAQAQRPGQQSTDKTFCAGQFHTGWFSFAAVKAVCSSCR